MFKRAGVIGILILAFLGLADSVYLAEHQVSSAPLMCGIGNLTGCTIVAESPYSRIIGIPLAEYGVLFYTIVFILVALELVLTDHLLRRILQGLAAAGLSASIIFTALQMFVIKAVCVYCLASALVSLGIFVAALFIEPISRTLFKKETPPSPPLPPRLLPMPPRT